MKSFFMVVRIVVACLVWGVIYEYAIPFINALVYAIPVIGKTRMADGIMSMLCIMIALFVSMIVRTSLERYILLALCMLYLAMLGIILPLSSGQPPYLNWQFGNIVFGSALGLFISARIAKEEEDGNS